MEQNCSFFLSGVITGPIIHHARTFLIHACFQTPPSPCPASSTSSFFPVPGVPIVVLSCARCPPPTLSIMGHCPTTPHHGAVGSQWSSVETTVPARPSCFALPPPYAAISSNSGELGHYHLQLRRASLAVTWPDRTYHCQLS